MKKVLIVGAGIGGLATANLLAAAGYEVAVYEKHGQPGGRAGVFEADGFTFDTGPSWYLMPDVFSHYFELFGEDIGASLQLKRLDPAYKVFFDTQDPLTIHADLERDRQTFETVEAGAGRKLEQYLNRSKATYDMAISNFLYTNFENKRSLLSPTVLRSLPMLAGSMATPIDRSVRGYFRDQRLRQIMEYPMVFLGTSPYEAPAMYSLMSHMDFTQGVYYPKGGLYNIIRALVRIGKKQQVQYHYNEPIARILSADGRSTGIETVSGRQVAADIVISNADLHYTETELVAPADRTYGDRYWNKKQAGPSALLMYLGIKGKLPELSHHNLMFTEDWKGNFDAIFKSKTWPEPASIYLCKPSQSDPTVAPEGHENVFVLVPGPASADTTSQELERLSEGYVDQIAAMTGASDLRQRIVYKHIRGPGDFAADFNSWQGTALGLSHRLSQSALFRPANRSKKLSNLYYVGGNTVPGIGLPMCLIGAELIYKRLAHDTTAAPITQIRRRVE